MGKSSDRSAEDEDKNDAVNLASPDGPPEDSDTELEGDSKKKKKKFKKHKRPKKGDYVVQVHIIECRDLKGRDFGDMSDPVVVVKCMGQKKTTRIHKRCLSCVFDQVLVFEFPALEPVALERGKVTLEVFDANAVRRNVLIGSYEFDLAWCYFLPDHEVYRQWVALSDLTDKNEGIQGYLRQSIVVLGPDDEMKIHDASDDEDDDENQMLSVLMPPTIEQKGFLLKLQCWQGNDLPRMDEGFMGRGTCDAYVKAEFAGVKVKGKKVKATLDPQWCYELQVPVMEPIMGSQITVSVYDWDIGSGDDRISTFTMDYERIKQESIDRAKRNSKKKDGEIQEKPIARWFHMYGAPQFKQKGIASKMNKGYVEGSFYRGRALFSAEVIEEDEPKASRGGMVGTAQSPDEMWYTIQCDLYEGADIVDNMGDMHVELAYERKVYPSHRVPVQEGCAKWYCQLGTDDSGQNPSGNIRIKAPVDTSQCADVFIYLCRKEERVSFLRIPFDKIMKAGWKTSPAWRNLAEDKVLDKLDEDQFPGSLLLGIRGGPETTCPIAVDPLCRPFLNKHLLMAQEQQARSHDDDDSSTGLLQASASGQPDPPSDLPEQFEHDGKILQFCVAPPSTDYVEYGGFDCDISWCSPAECLSFAHGFYRDAVAGYDVCNDCAIILYRQQQQTTSVSVDINEDKRASTSPMGSLQVFVLEAQNLPAMDRGGTSDPFVKIKVDGNDKLSHKTQVKKKTLDPKWNEQFRFERLNHDQTLTFKIYDWDKLGGNEKLGETSICIKDLSDQSAGFDFTVESWYLVSQKFGNARIKLRLKWKYDATIAAQNATVKKHGGFLGIGASTKPGQPKKKKNWLGKTKKDRERVGISLGEPSRRSCQLRCHIFQARNLPSVDSSGLCDSYMRIRFCGQSVKTRVIKETLNPIWYESICMNVQVPVPFRLAPDIQVQMYDEDTFSKDDVIGFFRVNCQKAYDLWSRINSDGQIDKPRWLPITDVDGQPSGGEVLASFQFVDAQHIGRPIPSLKPVTLPMWLQIATLGCRDLNSTLGVHKPFIKFEIASLASTGGDGKKKRSKKAKFKKFKTKASRDPSAKSPNFLQVIRIPIEIPEDPLYAPTLDIEVRDQIFGGMIKRLIGQSSLPLSILMQGDDWKSQATRKVQVVTDSDVQRAIVEDEEEALAREREEAAQKAAAEAKKRADEAERALAHQTNSDESPSNQKQALLANTAQSDDDYGTIATTETELTPTSLTAVSVQDHEENNAQQEGDNPRDLEPLTNSSKAEAGAVPQSSNADQVDVMAERNAAFHEQDVGLDDNEIVSMDDDEVPAYMHSRHKMDDELEDHITCQPFHQMEVKVGQRNAGRGGNKERSVGFFKGLLRLTQHKDDGLGMDVQEFLRPKELFVRLYILRAHKLNPKDSDGSNDPYLKIRMGKTKISTRTRYIKNTCDPEFYERFEIPCVIPGDAKLDISLWDWDGIGDDLIGSTTIDIEDRWFTKDWRRLKKKPLEFRTLRSPSSTFPQGKLEMWMEILDPLESKQQVMWDIAPPPPEEWELRVIIWNAKGVTIKDTMTDMNDMYCTGTPDWDHPEKLRPQKTDKHLRAQKGRASWNWRMKFPVQLPQKRAPRFRLQLWDADLLAANDSICEVNLSLKALFKKAFKKKEIVKMKFKRDEKIWLDNLKHPNFEGSQGKLRVSFELLPAAQARQLPAGLGRSGPNMNPVLPEPVGRIRWTINPIVMLRQLLGDQLCMKLCALTVVAMITSFCFTLGPQVVSTLISKKINKS